MTWPPYRVGEKRAVADPAFATWDPTKTYTTAGVVEVQPPVQAFDVYGGDYHSPPRPEDFGHERLAIPPPPPVPKDAALTNAPPPRLPPDAPGRKDDQGKLRYHLIPPRALQEVAAVLTFGGNKYGDDNWRKVMAAAGGPSRYIDAYWRHQQGWALGLLVDPESGFHPLAHSVVSQLFLIDTELGGK